MTATLDLARKAAQIGQIEYRRTASTPTYQGWHTYQFGGYSESITVAGFTISRPHILVNTTSGRNAFMAIVDNAFLQPTDSDSIFDVLDPWNGNNNAQDIFRIRGGTLTGSGAASSLNTFFKVQRSGATTIGNLANPPSGNSLVVHGSDSNYALLLRTPNTAPGRPFLGIYGYQTTDVPIGNIEFVNQASGNQTIAQIYASRAGASNSGSLRFETRNAGAGNLSGVINPNGSWIFGVSAASNFTAPFHTVNGGLRSGGTGSGDEARNMWITANAYTGNHGGETRTTGLSGALIVLDSRTSNSAALVQIQTNRVADGATTPSTAIFSADALGNTFFGDCDFAATGVTSLTHKFRSSTGRCGIGIESKTGATGDGNLLYFARDSGATTDFVLGIAAGAGNYIATSTTGDACFKAIGGGRSILFGLANDETTRPIMKLTGTSLQMNAGGSGVALQMRNTAAAAGSGGGYWQVEDNTGTLAHYLTMGTSFGTAGAGDMAWAINNLGGLASKKIRVVNRTGGVELLDGATAWSVLSDLRMKNVHSHITDAVEALSGLQTFRYSYKSDGPQGRVHLGLAAQEVQAVFPELVDSRDDILSLNTTGLIPVLVKAVQELNADLKEARDEIVALKGMINGI